MGTDSNGCFGIATTTVIVKGGLLYVPNAFSPNGDGKNDVFYVYGSGFRNVHLSIFDRWGEMVFESYDVTVGWDGTFSGKTLPPDVFVYEADITFIDGSKKLAKGSVTLVR